MGDFEKDVAGAAFQFAGSQKNQPTISIRVIGGQSLHSVGTSIFFTTYSNLEKCKIIECKEFVLR